MKTKILELNSAPYENGKFSGVYFKEKIDSKIIKEINDIIIKEELLNEYEILLTNLKNNYPTYYDEIKGKADGLNVDLMKYFAILCPELSNINFEHCTTIICKKENGNFIISHNEDDNYINGNFCLSKVKIDENNWFVTNDMYNMPFGNGVSFNSYGILKTINYCHEEVVNPKYMPRYFAQRHISEAKSIDDLIARCKEMKVASGFHINAIDINNNIAVSIEVYKDDIDVVYIDDFYVHSNHFIHGDHINNQLTDAGSNGIFRLEKATELVSKSNRDIMSIKNILKYRDSNDKFENSIFQTEKDPYITIFNMSFDTEDKDNVIFDIFVNDESFTLDYNIK